MWLTALVEGGREKWRPLCLMSRKDSYPACQPQLGDCSLQLSLARPVSLGEE